MITSFTVQGNLFWWYSEPLYLLSTSLNGTGLRNWQIKRNSARGKGEREVFACMLQLSESGVGHLDSITH